jgi:hypothetical protein
MADRTRQKKGPSLPTQNYPDSNATGMCDGEAVVSARPAFHGLKPGDTITLSSGTFSIERTLCSPGHTGEATVYLVRDNEGHPYSVKLYRDFTDPREEPNPEALGRIAEIEDRNILRLHGYGTGREKYQGRFCYELSDFAEGGTLADYPRDKITATFVGEHVVRQIAQGIRALHEACIYHCDLKPENVFFIDSARTHLVIGDYGSAKTSQAKRTEARHTSFAKGTAYYRAPEQVFDNLVSVKNDYYSLGMILIHLLYPHALLGNGPTRLRERIINGRPIVDFDPRLGALNQLIGGLTLYKPDDRWGEADVARWLAGEHVEVRYQHPQLEPIKLDATRQIGTVSELCAYIDRQHDWYEAIVADEDVFRIVKGWVLRLEDRQAKDAFERVVRSYQHNGEYVRQAILRYFQPERPIQIDLTTYDLDGDEDLRALVARAVRQLDDLLPVSDFQKLRFWFFQLEFALVQRARTPKDARARLAKQLCSELVAGLGLPVDSSHGDYRATCAAKLTPTMIVRLAWSFDPTRGFRGTRQARLSSAEEILAFFATKDPSFEQRELLAELEAFLAHRSPDVIAGRQVRVRNRVDSQRLLWRAGARVLWLGKRPIRKPEQLLASSDRELDSAISSDLIPSWLIYALGSVDLAKKIISAHGSHEAPLNIQAVRWVLGDRALTVGAAKVATLRELREAADRDTHAFTQLLTNGLLVAWLKSVRGDSALAQRLQKLDVVSGDAAKTEKAMQLLGALAPRLEVRPKTIRLGAITKNGVAEGELTLVANGRGRIFGAVTVSGECTSRLSNNGLSLSALEPGQQPSKSHARLPVNELEASAPQRIPVRLAAGESARNGRVSLKADTTGGTAEIPVSFRITRPLVTLARPVVCVLGAIAVAWLVFLLRAPLANWLAGHSHRSLIWLLELVVLLLQVLNDYCVFSIVAGALIAQRFFDWTDDRRSLTWWQLLPPLTMIVLALASVVALPYIG